MFQGPIYPRLHFRHDASMSWKILPLLVALCLGILTGTVIPVSRILTQDPVADSPDPDLREDYAATELPLPATGELGQLRAQNRELNEEINRLRNQVSSLEKQLNDTRQATEGNPEDSQEQEPTAETKLQGEAALIEAGIDPPTATWIQERLDQDQMDELYLRDRAIREGWIDTPRYRKALRELRARFGTLREEYGDDIYDRLLFASGRHNRVTAHTIMHQSPAGEYGMIDGDMITGYDGQRIFSSRELLELTSGGNTGTLVIVEVIREGQPTTLYLPRGPLGIRLQTTRVRP